MRLLSQRCVAILPSNNGGLRLSAIHILQAMSEVPSNIWLLRGYAGSGKDTLAAMLVTLLPDCAVSAFAAAAKEHVSQNFGIARHLFDTQDGKSSTIGHMGITVRELLIREAQTAKSESGNPEIWAERVTPPASRWPASCRPASCCRHWILSDWRFREELECLRRRFPHSEIHTILIRRASAQPVESATEHQLDDVECDAVIDNDGSLEDLRDCAEAMVAVFLSSAQSRRSSAYSSSAYSSSAYSSSACSSSACSSS
jgi:hypothetical protein